MNINLDFDYQGMINALEDLKANIDSAKSDAVNTVASALRDKMREYASAGHPVGPNVDTGNLVASINWNPIAEGVAEVGTKLEYAPYVEYGHSQQPGRYVPAIGKRLVQSFSPAYPFFRPAIGDIIDGGTAADIIKSVIESHLEEAAADMASA
jgi:hypothetical protein